MHQNRFSRTVRTIVLTGASLLIAIAVNAQTAPDNTTVTKGECRNVRKEDRSFWDLSERFAG
jgi:hypothetical protein